MLGERDASSRNRDNRLAWTPLALLYAAGGVLAIAAGAVFNAVLLVLLGGMLIAAVVLDAARTLGRLPRTRLAISPDRVPEDAKATIRLHAEGVGPRHQVWVALSPALHLTGSSSNILDHWGRADDNEFEVRAKVRGPQQVGPVVVREWTPLNLWASDRTVERPRWLEVIPRTEDASNVGLVSKILRPMQGRFNVNRPGQGMDFFALRDYQQGDTIRSINWKATARADDLIVNQRQRETQSQLLLLLDARVVSGLGPMGHTPLDRGCRAILGLFKEAVNARDSVHFYAYGNGVQGIAQVPAGQRVTALESFLARLPASGRTPLTEAWKDVGTRSSMNAPIVVVTSAEADPGVADTVADMIGRGHPVTVLSPTPVGPDWDADPQRRARREGNLDKIRDRGAVVVDWGATGQLQAEKPSAQIQVVG